MSTPIAWSRVNVYLPDKHKKKKSPRRKFPSESSDDDCAEEEFGMQLKKTKDRRRKLPWEAASESSDDDCAEEEFGDMMPRPLALWLSRARDSELYLCMGIGRIAPRVDYLCQAIQHLNLHFHKMKELDLVVESESTGLPLNSVVGMLRQPIPALKHLTLSTGAPRRGPDVMGDSKEYIEGFWKFLNDSESRLHSLTLSRCLLGPMPAATGGRCPHLALHTLTLEDTRLFGLNKILETIQPFLCLETLNITSSNPASFNEIAVSPRSIILPLDRIHCRPRPQ
ncbi:hypothetical protein C8R44DRAFT_264913 [Mycena epipterygia]|nr:hypothetical protein C8R44DRAFT_264913 [Mycena epipterygia]